MIQDIYPLIFVFLGGTCSQYWNLDDPGHISTDFCFFGGVHVVSIGIWMIQDIHPLIFVFLGVHDYIYPDSISSTKKKKNAVSTSTRSFITFNLDVMGSRSQLNKK
jgi:hypothetical protein